jgi:hypothetical protein
MLTVRSEWRGFRLDIEELLHFFNSERHPQLRKNECERGEGPLGKRARSGQTEKLSAHFQQWLRSAVTQAVL